jgi:hypothetical protein
MASSEPADPGIVPLSNGARFAQALERGPLAQVFVAL